MSSSRIPSPLQTAFKTFRDSTSNPGEFLNGELVHDRKGLPAPMASSARVVSFQLDGQRGYYTEDRVEEYVHFGLYNQKGEPIAQAKQYAEDEGGLLEWK